MIYRLREAGAFRLAEPATARAVGPGVSPASPDCSFVLRQPWEAAVMTVSSCHSSGRPGLSSSPRFTLVQLWLLRAFGEWTRGWALRQVRKQLRSCVRVLHKQLNTRDLGTCGF